MYTTRTAIIRDYPIMETTIRGKKRAGTILLGEDSEPFFVPTDQKVILEDGFFQTYYSSVLAMFQLRGCAYHLIMFMAMKMDKDNIVDFPMARKEEFLRLCVEDKDGEQIPLYSLRTVENSMIVLKKKEFIEPIARASFKVSPIFFYKGGRERRARAVKMQLEFSATEKRTKVTTEVLYE